jgi:predicted house-cleaning noncanonical NTP pyrophosphatase (MazG superfamily)
MPREYDKLVRDDIPEIIEENGETAVTHTVAGEEYERRLFDKLDEEAAELRESPTVEELADVLEVVHAIRERRGITAQRVREKREQKVQRRGRFEDGTVLDRVE